MHWHCRAHPECVPELLEEGITNDLLRLLLQQFQRAAQEEANLRVCRTDVHLFCA